MAENQNEDMDIKSKDSLPDDLFVDADKAFDENTTEYTESHIAPSDEKSTSIEGEAEKKPAEPVKEEIPDKENPESFKYWQSQNDIKDRKIEDLERQSAQDRETWVNTQREIATVKEQLTPKVEPLVEPVKPLTQFEEDVTTWANYYEQKDAYRDKRDEQRQGEFNTFKQETENEKNLRLQNELAAQQKAHTLGEFQKQKGYDLEKANRALNYFAKVGQDPEAYASKLAEFYDWIENTETKKPRVTQEGEVVPLAVQTSVTDNQKVEENDEFFGDMKKFNYTKYY